MRTTLTLDPVVLSAARAKAAAENISLGQAVSQLALAGIARRSSGTTSEFPVLQGEDGHMITDELVAQYRDDE